MVIGIYEGNVFSPRGANPLVPRRGRAAVLLLDADDACVGDLFEPGDAVVGASVIDDNELDVLLALVEHAGHRCRQIGHRVVRRHDHGDQGPVVDEI